MAIQIHINKSQIADLKAIAELGPDALGEVVDAIEKFEPAPFTPAELQTVIQGVIKEDKSVVDSILRQALSLASFKRRGKLASTAIVEAIREALKAATPSVGAPMLAKWEALEPTLNRLVASRRVETTAKTLNLAYDYANLLRTTRIVTDVRPVFDNDVTTIDGAVVSFTLRLSYDNNEGNHGLSIAMNQPDVKALRDQCDRALKKSALAQETMAKLPFRVTVSGSEDYEPR